MKYKKCRLVCGLMICSLVMTGVTACSTSGSADGTESAAEAETTTGENTFAYTDGTETELVSTTVMASVDSVDGKIGRAHV